MPLSREFGRRAPPSHPPAQQPKSDSAQQTDAPEITGRARGFRPSPISALCLVGIIACTALFLTQTPPGRYYASEIAGRFDPRPTKTILLIGNSRTYYNDLPDMVRRMADSAHSPARLSITMLAWGGASFEENWNDEGVRTALGRHWDAVILQAESRAIYGDKNRASFSTYGRKLIAAAQQSGSPAAVIVNWGYGESLYSGPLRARDEDIGMIEQLTRALANQTDARIIDTCSVWERIHVAHPDLQLYEDGNHPTVAGSYISALMIYRFLSDDGVEKISYLPGGLDAQSADAIKRIVSQ